MMVWIRPAVIKHVISTGIPHHVVSSIYRVSQYPSNSSDSLRRCVTSNSRVLVRAICNADAGLRLPPYLIHRPLI